MKNIKKVLLVVFTVLMLFSMENVSAYSCRIGGDSENTCDKRNYRYSKDGSIHDRTITIGIGYSESGLEAQYVTAHDSWASSSSTHPIEEWLRYQTPEDSHLDTLFIYNNTYGLNSTTAVFPLAICVNPLQDDFVTSDSGLERRDGNVYKYVYFNKDSINTAINSGYCKESDIFYSAESVEKKCIEEHTVTTFELDSSSAANFEIFADSITAGQQKICHLDINYTVLGEKHSTAINDVDYQGACTSSRYRVFCNTVGDPTKSGSVCTLYSCDKYEGEETEKAGIECTLYNENDPSDFVTIEYIELDYWDHAVSDLTEYYGAQTIVKYKDTYPYYNNEDVYTGSCPVYADLFKEKEGSENAYSWKIFGTKARADLYWKDYEKYYAKGEPFSYTRYVLKNASDQENISPDYVNTTYPYEGKYTCGIFGEKTWGYIKLLYTIVRIAIPAIVIVLGMVDFATVVFSGEEKDMKASGQRFLKRVIIGVIFILLPVLIDFIFGLVNFSEDCLGQLIS